MTFSQTFWVKRRLCHEEVSFRESSRRLIPCLCLCGARDGRVLQQTGGVQVDLIGNHPNIHDDARMGHRMRGLILAQNERLLFQKLITCLSHGHLDIAERTWAPITQLKGANNAACPRPLGKRKHLKTAWRRSKSSTKELKSQVSTNEFVDPEVVDPVACSMHAKRSHKDHM